MRGVISKHVWCALLSQGFNHLLLMLMLLRVQVMMMMVTGMSDAVSSGLSSIPHQTDTHEEYCHYETFRARCGEGEVILIRSAVYGRMRLGQCVKQSFGVLGCFTDVIDILDDQCSGRQSCQLDVTDPTFQHRKPCSQEFKNYLQVRYSCIRVSVAASATCHLDMADAAITGDVDEDGDGIQNRGGSDWGMGGFLASPRTHLTHCGTHQSPWRITAALGQRINITLIDFSRASHTAAARTEGAHTRSSKICFKYGGVTEDDGKVNEDICASRQRETHIYTSQSHSLQIILSDNANFYLLSYQAVGCPHLATTDQRWFRVTGTHTLMAGCRNTETVWHLRCHGNRWIGAISNCSQQRGDDIESNSLDGMEPDARVLPPVLTVGVVLGVAVTISLCIVVVGLLCLRRLRVRRVQRGKGDILLRAGGGSTGGERMYSPPSMHTPADLWANDEPLYTCRSEYCHCTASRQGSQGSLRHLQQSVVYAPASAFKTYSTAQLAGNKGTATLDLVPQDPPPSHLDSTKDSLLCEQAHTEL